MAWEWITAPFLIVGFGLSLAPAAEAVKVVDSATPIPGGRGVFKSFGVPSLSGDAVAFYARGEGDQEGLYFARGGKLDVIADKSTQGPGGVGRFEFFGFRPAGSGGKFVFGAKGEEADGLFTFDGRSLSVVVDERTRKPGRDGTFSFTDLQPAIWRDVVAFADSSEAKGGIYLTEGGMFWPIIGYGAEIPGGGGRLTAFYDARVSGRNVAFVGVGPGVKEGVYASIGGSLRLVANQATDVPGVGRKFEKFDMLAIDGDDVVFRGHAVQGWLPGVYSFVDGRLRVLAEPGMPLPGERGVKVSSIISFSTSGGRVVLCCAKDTAGTGLYLTDIAGGEFKRVIGSGDRLGDEDVGLVEISEWGFDGERVAFRASLGRSREGVCIAPVPAGE